MTTIDITVLADIPDEMIKLDWVYEPVLPGDKDYPASIPATTSVVRDIETGLVLFD